MFAGVCVTIVVDVMSGRVNLAMASLNFVRGRPPPCPATRRPHALLCVTRVAGMRCAYTRGVGAKQALFILNANIYRAAYDY